MSINLRSELVLVLTCLGQWFLDFRMCQNIPGPANLHFNNNFRLLDHTWSMGHSWTVIGLGGQLISTALFNRKEITSPKVGKQ